MFHVEHQLEEGGFTETLYTSRKRAREGPSSSGRAP